MPTTRPIGVKSLVSNHRSSNQPMPPQTMNPPSRVVITAQPSSAPFEGARGTSRVFMATGHYQPQRGVRAPGPGAFYRLSNAGRDGSGRVDVEEFGGPYVAHVRAEPQ